MKRILFACVLTMGCSAPSVRDPYHPTRPAEIPAITCSGDSVEWDWKKQRAWDEGRLFVEKREDCVIAIILKAE